jgi:diguanylate cyclase (GGDEF)-like protein/PAS domain S-box-containing protein
MWHSGRWSLRSLLYTLSAAVFIPMALLVGLNIAHLYESGQDLAEAEALRLARLTAYTTETFILDARQVLATMARRPQIAAALAGGQCDPIFASFKDFYPQLSNMSLSNPAGFLICSSLPQPDGKPLPVAHMAWFQQVYERQEFVVGPILFGPINRNWISVLSEPVRSADGKMIGALQTPIDLLRFRLLPAVDQLPPEILITIFDTDGNIVARSRDPEGFVGRNVSMEYEILEIAITQHEGTADAVDSEGVPRFYGFTPIEGTNWIAVAGVDADYALAGARRNALIGAPIMALVFLFAIWLSRRIGQPIQQVSEAARLAGSGQLDTRVPTRGPVEIREVAERFNAMLTAIEESQTRLSRSEERLKLALDSSRTAIWDLEVGRETLYLSETWCELMGGQPFATEIALRELLHRIPPPDRKVLRDAYRNSLHAGHDHFMAEHRIRNFDDTLVWIETQGRVTERDTRGRPSRMLGVIHDISERKQREAEIHRLAYFDVLTGLPNRRLLLKEASKTLARLRRIELCGALMFIDLDRFKSINDARGHKAGDALLRSVAERLSSSVREGDTVARMGGDEFVVLMSGVSADPIHAARAAHALAEKIRSDLERPFEIEGQFFTSSASIGVALMPQAQEGVEDLLRAADIAMYRAKAGGRNQIAFFESQMQVEIERRLSLESDLAVAIERGQLAIHLQPQVDAAGLQIGAEILLRWLHPEHGIIPPADFIHVAEESGLILRIGDWVLEQACKLAAELRARGSTATLAVNVSPRQFHQADFAERVKRVIAANDCPPNQLIFEVTENLLLDHLDTTIERMIELSTLGIRFSIDDFGTGYSSLSYLKRLPLYELKIDKSFVEGIPADRNDCEIVQMIISLARQLRLSVVAEGVETPQQRTFLCERSCNVMQGYFFGRPEPANEWLAKLPETAQP